MPIKCYNKPNRKNPRMFTVKDVQRISRIMQRQGVNPITIIAGVFVALGLGATVCKGARSVSNVLAIQSYFLDIGVALGLAKIIDWLIQLFGKKLYVLIPKWNVVAILFILFLGWATNVLKKIGEVFSARADIEKVANTLDELCKEVKRIAAESGQKIEDLVEDSNLNLDPFFEQIDRIKDAIEDTIK